LPNWEAGSQAILAIAFGNSCNASRSRQPPRCISAVFSASFPLLLTQTNRHSIRSHFPPPSFSRFTAIYFRGICLILPLDLFFAFPLKNFALCIFNKTFILFSKRRKFSVLIAFVELARISRMIDVNGWLAGQEAGGERV
jgi:hypothetical protein